MSIKSRTGICKLCLQEKMLIGKSHIIPQFMYKGVFDEKNRIAEVKLSDLKSPIFRQSGFYSSNILCANCDNQKIGTDLEDYAYTVFFQRQRSRYPLPQIDVDFLDDGLRTEIWKGIDYKRFKLFLLSILWRSSISNLQNFKEVSLGKYEEKIRKMIFAGDAGSQDFIPISILKFERVKDIPWEGVHSPIRIKTEGSTIYAFLIQDKFYLFGVSEHNRPELFEKGTIWKDDTMVIPILERNRAYEFYDSFLKKRLRLKTT